MISARGKKGDVCPEKQVVLILGFNSLPGHYFQVDFLIPGQDMQTGDSTNRDGGGAGTSTLTNRGTVIFFFFNN